MYKRFEEWFKSYIDGKPDESFLAGKRRSIVFYPIIVTVGIVVFVAVGFISNIDEKVERIQRNNRKQIIEAECNFPEQLEIYWKYSIFEPLLIYSKGEQVHTKFFEKGENTIIVKYGQKTVMYQLSGIEDIKSYHIRLNVKVSPWQLNFTDSKIIIKEIETN